MDGHTFRILVYTAVINLVTSFDASLFTGLTKSSEHSVEHIVEHRWNKRSTGEVLAPYLIHTRIIHHGSDATDDVKLKFRKSGRNIQTPVMFKGSGGSFEYIYNKDKRCVWLYEAEDTFAHAVVDGCHSDGRIRMVAELYVNNTHHVILPTESEVPESNSRRPESNSRRPQEHDGVPELNIVHSIYTVNATVNFTGDYERIESNDNGEQVQRGDTETGSNMGMTNNTNADTSNRNVASDDTGTSSRVYDGEPVDTDDKGTRSVVDDEEPVGKRRTRRGTATAYVVELMMVIDYTLYQFWYNQTSGSTVAERETAAINKLRSFYAFLANSINLRFTSLHNSQATVHVELASLYVLKTPEEGFSYNASTSGTRGTMNAAPALVEIKSWVENKRANDNNFPVADHTMLMTARDVILDGSSASAGFANLDSVCTLFSVSVTEDHFDFISAVVASHELAHSLGGRHDGDGNTCHSNDGYILATSNSVQSGTKALHPWQFSTCSAFTIRAYLSAGTTTCLTTDDIVPVITAAGTMVGQLFTADEQCKNSLGPNSELARLTHAGNFAAICTGMWCTSGNIGTVYRVIPADGTTCGNNKWCISGQCTGSNSAPAANDVCPFGDQPGEYTPGFTCSQTVQQRLSDCLSAQVQSACCQACEAAKLNIAGCPYGDKSDCSAIHASQCYGSTISNDNCCKTCTDFEKSYLPSDCKYGDKNINCAPRFCTVYPVQCCGTCSNVTAPPTVTTTAAPAQSQHTGTGVTTATITTRKTTTTRATATGGTDSETMETKRWLIPVAAGVGTLLVLFGVAGLIRCLCCRNHPEPLGHRRYKQNVANTWGRGIDRSDDRAHKQGKHGGSPRQQHNKNRDRYDNNDYRDNREYRERTHSLA